MYDSCSPKENHSSAPGLQVLCWGTFCRTSCWPTSHNQEWTHHSVCGRPFWSVECEITTVVILVLWSQKQPCFDEMVALGNISWFDLMGNPSNKPHPLNIPLNVNIVYNKKFMLYWRRFEYSDWDHKLTKKLFTELFNQDRSRVIFP